MIRPTSFGKIYHPIPSSNNKPVQVVPSTTFSTTMRIQPVSTAAAPPVSDQLQISPQGSFQRSLAESAAAIGRETATVSPQRLAELKQQIAQGTYQVSAGDLADAMLSRSALAKGAY